MGAACSVFVVKAVLACLGHVLQEHLLFKKKWRPSTRKSTFSKPERCVGSKLCNPGGAEQSDVSFNSCASGNAYASSEGCTFSGNIAHGDQETELVQEAMATFIR